MGWGIDFNSDIYLSRQDYSENIYLVEEKINELEKENQVSKEKILMYAASTPKDVIMQTEESTDILLNIQLEINEIFEYIRENIEQILKLTYYKEYLENKDKT